MATACCGPRCKAAMPKRWSWWSKPVPPGKKPQSYWAEPAALTIAGAPGLAAAAFHPGGAAHRYRLHGAFHCLLLHRHGECRTAVALPGPFPALGGGGRPSRRGTAPLRPCATGGKAPKPAICWTWLWPMMIPKPPLYCCKMGSRPRRCCSKSCRPRPLPFPMRCWRCWAATGTLACWMRCWPITARSRRATRPWRGKLPPLRAGLRSLL